VIKGSFEVRTNRRIETLDITGRVQDVVSNAGDGICVVYTRHTTTAIGINEGADPDVKRDIEATLTGLFPKSGDYRHSEGNSDAHLKSVIIGPSETVFVEGGALQLGRWQTIYFCEFDGPRTRTIHVRMIEG
jgi:secondary thiamine-phosphate synthase enzyme